MIDADAAAKLRESARTLHDAVNAGSSDASEFEQGIVTRIDPDGTAWVHVEGSSSDIPCRQEAAANAGNAVTVRIDASGRAYISGNESDPSLTGNQTRILNGRAMSAAGEAVTIAEEAAAVANATNQHFWSDDNGAHVTDETQDEWVEAAAGGFADLSDSKNHWNSLWNSLGMLFRRALNNLVSITRSAVAFYDGEGNEAENITASFGKDGYQIGRDSESRMVGDYHSLQMVDKEGTTYFHASDLRNRDGEARVVERFVGDGQDRTFDLSCEIVAEIVSVAVDGIVASAELLSNDENWVARLAEPPADGAEVVISYIATSDDAKAYTFGKRYDGSQIGPMSVAEGLDVTASGYASHAEGDHTVASGWQSHAEGANTTASGMYAHSEGASTTASGYMSHSEGSFNTASGPSSHAEGGGAHASGLFSHAEGTNTEASGFASHAQNFETVAMGDSQTALGKYNVADNTSAVIVGNGTSNSNRRNAMTLDWSGNAWVAGDVTDGGGNVLSDKADASSLGALASKDSLAESDIPSLPASKITSGTFAAARIPSLAISKITDLQSTLDGKLEANSTDASALINALPSATGTPQDADYFIGQYAGGGTTNTSYRRKPLSSLWTWIQGKLQGFVATLSGGTALTSSDDLDDLLDIGTYYISGSSNTPANGPSSSMVGKVIVSIPHGLANSNIRAQEYTYYLNGRRYWRKYESSAWGAWQRHPIDSDFTPTQYNVTSLVTQSSTQSGNFTVDSATLWVSGYTAQIEVAFKIGAALTAGTEYGIGTLNTAIRPVMRTVAGIGDRRAFADISAGVMYIRPEVAMSASTSTTYYLDATYILASRYTG